MESKTLQEDFSEIGTELLHTLLYPNISLPRTVGRPVRSTGPESLLTALGRCVVVAARYTLSGLPVLGIPG